MEQVEKYPNNLLFFLHQSLNGLNNLELVNIMVNPTHDNKNLISSNIFLRFVEYYQQMFIKR